MVGGNGQPHFEQS